MEDLLTPLLKPYSDIETRLRQGAAGAWTVFFAFLSVLVLSSVGAAAIWGSDNSEAQALFVGVVLAVTTLFFVGCSWEQVRPQLSRVGFTSSASWVGLIILIPMLGLNYYYHGFLSDSLDFKTEGYMEYFSNWWGVVLMVCVFPAIFEELGFRGVIQVQFEKVVEPKIAILVGAALFSMAHFSIYSAPYLMLVGVLFGWMRWRTGSLYPPMVAHFIHNFVVINWS